MVGAGIELKRFQQTGGERLDFAIRYGDASEARRMSEAFAKAESHRVAAERYRTDQRVYETQDRGYELDTDDVHYYRLNGAEREE